MSIFSRKPKVTPVVAPDSDVLIAKERSQVREAYSLPEMLPDGTDPAAQLIYARIIPTKGGYAYEVCKDGVAFIRQDFHPMKEGFVPMTKDEAESLSRALVLSHMEMLYGGN